MNGKTGKETARNRGKPGIESHLAIALRPFAHNALSQHFATSVIQSFPKYMGSSDRKDAMPEIDKKGGAVAQPNACIMILECPPQRHSEGQAAVK